MTFDAGLAERLRALLDDRPGIREQRMMGALVFLQDGAMICGVAGDDLLLRLGPEAAAEALTLPHVRPFRLGASRSPRSFVLVEAEGVAEDQALRTGWHAPARASAERGSPGEGTAPQRKRLPEAAAGGSRQPARACRPEHRRARHTPRTRPPDMSARALAEGAARTAVTTTLGQGPAPR
ncbi:TfoX/Sxy family protein [Frigidibacter sp. MR17.14]|uniref:TfoX/Sxy family protein n=1 Tax=Frigidibacter sp. MR17.14 TaxID=3126509 RepID=UPI003012C4AC